VYVSSHVTNNIKVYRLRLHGVDTIAVKKLRNPGSDGTALRAEAAMMMRGIVDPQSTRNINHVFH
jgi:hypothetical protein